MFHSSSEVDLNARARAFYPSVLKADNFVIKVGFALTSNSKECAQ